MIDAESKLDSEIPNSMYVAITVPLITQSQYSMAKLTMKVMVHHQITYQQLSRTLQNETKHLYQGYSHLYHLELQRKLD